MQDFLLKTLGNREAKKKMSSTNAKALNTMRQRLKKHNTQFQEQIDAFRQHPETSEGEDSEDDLDEDESESTDTDVSVAGQLAGYAQGAAGLHVPGSQSSCPLCCMLMLHIKVTWRESRQS